MEAGTEGLHSGSLGGGGGGVSFEYVWWGGGTRYLSCFEIIIYLLLETGVWVCVCVWGGGGGGGVPHITSCMLIKGRLNMGTEKLVY